MLSRFCPILQCTSTRAILMPTSFRPVLTTQDAIATAGAFFAAVT